MEVFPHMPFYSVPVNQCFSCSKWYSSGDVFGLVNVGIGKLWMCQSCDLKGDWFGFGEQCPICQVDDVWAIHPNQDLLGWPLHCSHVIHYECMKVNCAYGFPHCPVCRQSFHLPAPRRPMSPFEESLLG